MKHKYNKYFIFLMIAIASIVVSRGLFTDRQLAGHDTASYYITQHQFHKNIAEGNLFPRWAPDMRYGYGHPKLQYRPPLLHYLAEPLYAISANPALSINTAVILLVFIAGTGMFFCCRMYMKSQSAMLGAIAYLTFNYLLSDIYIRGAYYEVAAYAFMPWILWGQVSILRSAKENKTMKYILAIYSLCWAALICSHPQIMVFFIPLTIVHFLFSWNESRNHKSAIFAIIATFAGFCIAAPYWFVAWRELQYVRMELFYTGLEAYSHHFLSFRELLFEQWPETYQQFSHLDFLSRPRHTEMRSLNIWAIFVLAIVPFLWFFRSSQKSKFNRISMMFYICSFSLIFLALPFSKGVWFLLSPLHTFNFPWRVLAVAALPISMLTGLIVHQLLRKFNIPENKLLSVCILPALFMVIFACDKTSGWKPSEDQLIQENLYADIDKVSGIPKQFYTPRWVEEYSQRPTDIPVRFIEGLGNIESVEKKVTEWYIKMNAQTDAGIVLAHYFYPGWKLFAEDNQEIKLNPLKGTGEISFTLKPGAYKLRLIFTNTFDRVLANILVLFGALVLVLITKKSKLTTE